MFDGANLFREAANRATRIIATHMMHDVTIALPVFTCEQLRFFFRC